MTRTSRIASVLAGLAVAAAVSAAVPATALADEGKTIPPCGVTGAYAWQDTCDPVAGSGGGH